MDTTRVCTANRARVPRSGSVPPRGLSPACRPVLGKETGRAATDRREAGRLSSSARRETRAFSWRALWRRRVRWLTQTVPVRRARSFHRWSHSLQTNHHPPSAEPASVVALPAQAGHDGGGTGGPAESDVRPVRLSTLRRSANRPLVCVFAMVLWRCYRSRDRLR